MHQMNLTEVCKHYWLIDSDNQGICQICGVEKDFVPENKRVFPKDYEKGFVGGLVYRKSYIINGGYCLQGRIRQDAFIESGNDV